MTILITGANGQVGSELRRRGGADIVALDRKGLDITQRGQTLEVVAQLKPRIIINAAAYTAVDKAETEVDAAFAGNRDGAAHLAEACSKADIPLLHLSTDYVFDGGKSSPYLESDEVNPQGVYARSKWEGEQRVRELLPQHIILRVSWVFGVHGNNFVKTMLRLARERPELRVVADQHGCPTSAAAIADALLLLARKAEATQLPWGTYHYTGTPATTWHGFAISITETAAELGLISKIPTIHAIATREYPVPAPRPANSLMDCSGAEQKLGLKRQDWRADMRDVLTTLA